MGYLLNTEPQQREMLAALGLKNLNDLYRNFPDSLIMKEGPNIPEGLAEQAILAAFEEFADKNKTFKSIFRGAGAYRHFIPAIVPEMVNKERFKTCYTPYQAEVSQGILQAIFEFQTMICELTGLDVSNASMYDGSSAAAEAAAMCRDRKRKLSLISGGINPRTAAVIKTYSRASDSQVEIIPVKDGLTDLDALKEMISDETASVMIQQPNFYGLFEDVSAIAEIARSKGAKLILSVNPIAAAVLPSAGELGADIAVGEGQPLGIPLSYGGPYLGFIAATSDLSRKMPGRIVGETVDAEGRRAFVLTLQAREQHIRRETASSNICSNQALMALTASVYMACMGPDGIREAAMQSYSKAHYLAEELGKLKGFNLRYDAPFFHEFVSNCPIQAERLIAALDREGILGGLPLAGNTILWCATEMNSKKDIDRLVAICREVTQ